MSQDPQITKLNSALKAVFLLIGDEKLQNRLQDEEQANSVLDRLGLPHETRGALLDIINKLSTRLANNDETKESSNIATGPISEVPRILLESFVHIRWSFWVSIVMSVALFLIGLVFLGTALIQSLDTKDITSSALTIAGLGLADFVLLFYTRPWKDVAANLANSQQIRMIASSYLAGLSLINVGTLEQLEALDELTEHSVGLIHKHVEESTTETNELTAQSEYSTG